MADGEPAERSVEPPPLEVMAALSSLLVHDLANHLSIITGNAQLAQMLSHDPERVEAALAAVVQASGMAGELVKRCGDLRRGLPNAFEPGDLATAGELTRRALSSWPRWSVQGPEGGARSLVPGPWISVTVREVVREMNAEAGRVSFGFRRADSGWGRGRRLPSEAGPMLVEIVVANDESKEFPFAEVKNGKSNLLFLAGYELISNCGGWFEFDAGPNRAAGVRFYVPTLATD